MSVHPAAVPTGRIETRSTVRPSLLATAACPLVNGHRVHGLRCARIGRRDCVHQIVQVQRAAPSPGAPPCRRDPARGVRAGPAKTEPGHIREVGPRQVLAQVLAEDDAERRLVRRRDLESIVEAAWAQESRIDALDMVRGGE